MLLIGQFVSMGSFVAIVLFIINFYGQLHIASCPLRVREVICEKSWCAHVAYLHQLKLCQTNSMFAIPTVTNS